LDDIVEKVQELSRRKTSVDQEMSGIFVAFAPDKSNYGSGCLRLEDVYCIKNGRRYGPYGPYYYLYFYKPDGMVKRYIGKRADRLTVRREALARLRALEAERKKILGLERKLRGILGMV
jgi:hypothetical protein